MKFINQLDSMDCGPACLGMIANEYGKDWPLEDLRNCAHITREGVSMMGIVEAAEKIGFETISSKLTIELLALQDHLFPCILHWNQKHFVVLRQIEQRKEGGTLIFHLADPAHGFVKVNQVRFSEMWLSSDQQGVALFLSPADRFFELVPPAKPEVKIAYLLSYLKPYRKQVFYMFLLLVVGGGIMTLSPFLTQALIDRGVAARNMHAITLILLAQLGLFISNIVAGVVRNWMMLHVGTQISIRIISDFLKKMLQLPIRFFDSKMMGDFHQRIQDNDRIEEFLRSQGLMTFFSMITFSVFFIVLCYYDFRILLLYLALTSLSVAWSLFWLKKRKALDYFRFQQKSENQDSIYEILNGVTELKLNQFEDIKRAQWEQLQQGMFRLNMKLLKLDQVQVSGFESLNQLKNILVTFLAATAVLKGQMTLGMLLSISFMIGQMNAPISQLILFFRSLQDARLSLQRLNEVQDHPVEEQAFLKKSLPASPGSRSKSAIIFENVHFQYEGPHSPMILRDINLHIEEGSVTAIVGASGSGKTTLMKLLLRFYDPVRGSIYLNNDDVISLSPANIRENSGVVMQDGYLFSDTIRRNITTGHDDGDSARLERAVAVANIKEWIESLPLGFDTKIGANGIGISGGQKQRILIARAVYKDPLYIFFDEATSALDAQNERIIHDNLQEFFRGKTVVIIAHRLSTVKNADKVIVLDSGMVSEEGAHDSLVRQQGKYFDLVRNQLELGV